MNHTQEVQAKLDAIENAQSQELERPETHSNLEWNAMPVEHKKSVLKFHITNPDAANHANHQPLTDKEKAIIASRPEGLTIPDSEWISYDETTRKCAIQAHNAVTPP